MCENLFLFVYREKKSLKSTHESISIFSEEEGNGAPLQCSCLENPRDGGAWWAAVSGSHRVGHDWSDLAAAAAAFFPKDRD